MDLQVIELRMLKNMIIETGSLKAMGWVNQDNECLSMKGVLIEKARKLLKRCNSFVVFSCRDANKIVRGIISFSLKGMETHVWNKDALIRVWDLIFTNVRRVLYILFLDNE